MVKFPYIYKGLPHSHRDSNGSILYKPKLLAVLGTPFLRLGKRLIGLIKGESGLAVVLVFGYNLIACQLNRNKRKTGLNPRNRFQFFLAFQETIKRFIYGRGNLLKPFRRMDICLKHVSHLFSLFPDFCLMEFRNILSFPCQIGKVPKLLLDCASFFCRSRLRGLAFFAESNSFSDNLCPEVVFKVKLVSYFMRKDLCICSILDDCLPSLLCVSKLAASGIQNSSVIKPKPFYRIEQPFIYILINVFLLWPL